MLAAVLTAGNVNDTTMLSATLDEIRVPRAGRPPAFDGVTRAATKAERRFNNLKRWRGIAMRTDKTARNFMAAIQLAAALNRLGASFGNAP